MPSSPRRHSEPDKPLTNQEAADLLGVHKNTVVNWKRDGTIREFTRAEVLRMREEMWTQFAPATEIPPARTGVRGRVVEGDSLEGEHATHTRKETQQ